MLATGKMKDVEEELFIITVKGKVLVYRYTSKVTTDY
jgi:hypothetical protein